jgi:tetratricopeptide (TPR) repeat protein
MLFPHGLEQMPESLRTEIRSPIFSALSQGYLLNGYPARAAALNRQANAIDIQLSREDSLSIGLSDLSNMLRLSGSLFESESVAREALMISRLQDNRFQEAVSLRWLGSTMAARGAKGALVALKRALLLDTEQFDSQPEGVDNAYLAQLAIWRGKFTAALDFANVAWELAQVLSYEADLIRAARRQGEALLGLGDLLLAEEKLRHALTRAGKVSLIQEELPTLIGLAELTRRQGHVVAAREYLNDVWEGAERGPYPLFHADALNVLAQIERDAGNNSAAIEAATKAFELASCDGPPFAYHWALAVAKKHLKELRASQPTISIFDKSKLSLPSVKIDPSDEFHVGEQSL